MESEQGKRPPESVSESSPASTPAPVKQAASNVAIIALCVSMAAAAFSMFQWWYGQRATKAAATVEVSRTYLRERDKDLVEKELNLLVDVSQQLLKAEEPLSPQQKSFIADKLVGEEEAIKIVRYSYSLGYILLLVDEGMLLRSYLSPVLACDIKVAYTILRVLNLIPPSPRMTRFKVDCYDLDKGFPDVDKSIPTILPAEGHSPGAAFALSGWD